MKIMSHAMLRPFIVKVSVLGYFPLVPWQISGMYICHHQGLQCLNMLLRVLLILIS